MFTLTHKIQNSFFISNFNDDVSKNLSDLILQPCQQATVTTTKNIMPRALRREQDFSLNISQKKFFLIFSQHNFRRQSKNDEKHAHIIIDRSRTVHYFVCKFNLHEFSILIVLLNQHHTPSTYHIANCTSISAGKRIGNSAGDCTWRRRRKKKFGN